MYLQAASFPTEHDKANPCGTEQQSATSQAASHIKYPCCVSSAVGLHLLAKSAGGGGSRLPEALMVPFCAPPAACCELEFPH